MNMRYFVRIALSLALGIILTTINVVASPENSTENICQYTFIDGVCIKVHDLSVTNPSGEITKKLLPRQVLDAAVLAYQTITYFKGFSSSGYSFANPDLNYAYDPDRTIDVYIGDQTNDNALNKTGAKKLSFKDAPCFDTIQSASNEYNAVILLPSNYADFIKSWERLNASSLGDRNLNIDLQGTLIHEMLHTILFYYNKNLSKQCSLSHTDPVDEMAKVDWYVEGLARYFETFVGAKHDFFSQGFKETLPDKIRFSRGGSNYFMRYPDQAFTDLRYENALFWKFIEENNGIEQIEKFSQYLRDWGRKDIQAALHQVSGMNMNELLKSYARAILFKDFGLKEDGQYLKDVAKTHLLYEAGNLYLIDGFDEKKYLGPTSSTDWVGQWENMRAHFDSPQVGGDNTTESDVSGWATDFYQVDVAPTTKELPWLGIYFADGASDLLVQFILVSNSGTIITQELNPIAPQELDGLSLNELIQKNNFPLKNISKIYVLITNTSPKITAYYQITTKSDS